HSNWVAFIINLVKLSFIYHFLSNHISPRVLTSVNFLPLQRFLECDLPNTTSNVSRHMLLLREFQIRRISSDRFQEKENRRSAKDLPSKQNPFHFSSLPYSDQCLYGLHRRWGFF